MLESGFDPKEFARSTPAAHEEFLTKLGFVEVNRSNRQERWINWVLEVNKVDRLVVSVPDISIDRCCFVRWVKKGRRPYVVDSHAMDMARFEDLVTCYTEGFNSDLRPVCLHSA